MINYLMLSEEQKNMEKEISILGLGVEQPYFSRDMLFDKVLPMRETGWSDGRCDIIEAYFKLSHKHENCEIPKCINDIIKLWIDMCIKEFKRGIEPSTALRDVFREAIYKYCKNMTTKEAINVAVDVWTLFMDDFNITTLTKIQTLCSARRECIANICAHAMYEYRNLTKGI